MSKLSPVWWFLCAPNTPGALISGFTAAGVSVTASTDLLAPRTFGLSVAETDVGVELGVDGLFEGAGVGAGAGVFDELSLLLTL